MKGRRFGIFAVGTAATLGLVAAGGHAAGFYVNTTASAPSGLWRVAKIDPQAIQRGSMVSICPPAVLVVEAMRDTGGLHTGDCEATETAPLLKPAVAVPGDVVAVGAEGIAVNGILLPNSRPMPGMPAYPSGSYRVQPGQIWAVSSYSAGSFDSRYFGPVPLENLRGRAVPVAVSGDTSKLTVRGKEK